MNLKSTYTLKFLWNLTKLFLMIFVFPFYYKDLETYLCGEYYTQNETGHDAFILISGVLWIYIMVSSYMRAVHYKIASLQVDLGYVDTGFHKDWSIMGMIKAGIYFFTVQLWEDSNKEGIDRLKDYRDTKSKMMSQKNAAREFAETSALDAIDSSQNKRVRDYVNTRIKTMSNEKAVDWIKNDMKD